MTTEVQGVTVVLVAPDGRACANASDFDTAGYGGCELYEAQRLRARRRCALNYIRAACNGDLADAICDGYPGAEGLVETLCRKQGYRITCIAHGYGDLDLNA